MLSVRMRRDLKGLTCSGFLSARKQGCFIIFFSKCLFFFSLKESVEKEMATHSSILAWRIPWTEDPGGLQSMGSQRVGHD